MKKLDVEHLITGYDFIKSLNDYEEKNGRLSELARALYIYNDICEYFSYKVDYFFFDKEEKKKYVNIHMDIYELIKDDETICTLFSQLYISLLKEAKIVENAELSGDSHQFAKFKINGIQYAADPIYDLTNAKIKARFKNFCQCTDKKKEEFPQLKGTVNLSEKEMDTLYEEIGYASVKSIGSGEKRTIYYDDVIKQLKEEMQDNDAVISLFKELYGVDLQLRNEPMEKDYENRYKLVYYKMKFIFEFLSENLKFTESESFYKQLFNELFSEEERSIIRYANLRDEQGNNSYIFEVKEFYEDNHYFKSSFEDGKARVQEVDIKNDDSKVTLFDSKYLNPNVQLKDISNLGKSGLVKNLIDIGAI